MISGTIYITINNVNPTILEETKMYNIYSVFRNLFILTLIVLLLSFVLLCVDKKIVKNKKIYKFIDKFQNAVSIICIISLFVFIISLMGFAVIWILLSKHFEQIGRFFSGMSPGDKNEDKKESEERDVKEER